MTKSAAPSWKWAATIERAAELNKERIDLEPLVEKAREYRQVRKRIEEARLLLASEEDAEMRSLAEMEIAELEPRWRELETVLKAMLVPKDPRDEKNVFRRDPRRDGRRGSRLVRCRPVPHVHALSPNARAGNTEVMSSSEIGIGGFKEVIFEIRGQGAFSKLKYESGVHRVQRVPATEAPGASTPPRPPWQ